MDFFISYTRADERWAEWLAWELEQAGYQTRLMAWDFRPGSNFVLEMQKAAVECDRTLLVLSPAYLNSAFAAPEWAAAFASDPTGTRRKLLPVRVAQCDPPGLLKTIVYIDLVGLDEDAARKELLDGIRTERAKPTTKPPFPAAAPTRNAPAFPGALPSIWNVPFPHNPQFTGRGALLEELHQQLAEQSIAATQPQAIHGLGGVGKTQLAVEYAWKHRAEYDAVLWVVADSPASAAANLAALCRANVLNLPEADEREQDPQLQAVCRWLREHSRWLLTFDSVDTPEAADAVRSLLPAALTGHVLITSRLSDWPPTVLALEVESLHEEPAAEFLLARTRARGFEAGTRADALALAKALGGLPLALEQAAAYVLRHRVTFVDYLARLDGIRPQLLRHEVEGGTRYQRSVAQTWLVSEAQLGVAARAVLRLAAFLAPDDVPRALFANDSEVLQEAVRSLAAECGSKRTEPPESADAQSALVELADHSLITLTPKAFSCHRLVQAVQADRLEPESRRRWTELALRLVNDLAPVHIDDVRTWPGMAAMRAHAEVALAHADKLGIAAPAARLTNQLGVFLHAKALHREAEPLMRRALAINEGAFGLDHPNVAICLNNLAQLLQATNRREEAEPLMRRALVIDQQSFGPGHPSAAHDLSNLAALLQATNRLGEAEPLMRRALAIDEQSLGPDHPNVARDLNNLAQLLLDTNRPGEAEPLMRRALAIDEESFGPDHPNVAIRLNNLAHLLEATNRLGAAEPLIRRALAIDEESFGPDHPSVAIRLNNLAHVLEATNRLEEAEPLVRRALAIDEESFGPGHPNVAIRLNNLARLLETTNRLGEAEPLMRRAAQIAEKALGAEHPNVATALNNLALLLQVTNRLGEAEPLMRRVVVIFRKFHESTGHEHPHAQTVIGNYAGLLEAMGLAEAEIRRRVREAAGG